MSEAVASSLQPASNPDAPILATIQSASADREALRRDRLLIAAFWLLYVAAGAQTSIATDTARDLLAAWDIAQGLNFPLRGPELYATWHLGPIWHYLLALPLWLTHSAAMSALLVATLAGLKFPLAYRLGFRFGGLTLARFSLLAIALPGWWMFEWLVASHTNLAATCVLGYALLLLSWARTGRLASVAGAALMFSLALHAHPTALFWGWLMIPALWHRRRLGGASWTQAALAVLMFLLPFAPMLVDEALSGWPMWTGTREFVAGRSSGSVVPRVLPFLRDLLMLDGQRMPGQFLIGPSWLGGALHVLQSLLVLAAMVGIMLLRVPDARFGRIAALALLFASAFVVLLRPEIPYWMSYALAPGVAAFLALGWHRLHGALVPVSAARRLLSTPPSRPTLAQQVLPGLWIAGALAFALLAMVRIQSSSQGWVSVPYRIVGRYADPAKQIDTRIPNAIFPVFGQEQLMRWLCSQARPLSLHGDGAALQRLSQGSLHLLHCADKPPVQLGGESGQRVALYPAYLVRQAGLDGGPSFAAMRQVGVSAVLHSALGEPDAVVRAYPPWPLTQRTSEHFELEVPAGHGLIAVSNLRPVFNGLDEPRLLVAGATVVPLARSAVTWVFRVPGAAGGRLVIATGNRRLVEVLALDDAPDH